MRSLAGQRQAPGAVRAPLPCVVVHDAAQASAALEAAGPAGVVLLSAPAAAGSLGAAWFLAIGAAAAASHPGVPHQLALDCGDQPGHALAALRAGLRLLVLDPALPAFPAVAAAATACGATLWTARPPALDLAGLRLDRVAGRQRLTQWLQGGPMTGKGASATPAAESGTAGGRQKAPATASRKDTPCSSRHG